MAAFVRVAVGADAGAPTAELCAAAAARAGAVERRGLGGGGEEDADGVADGRDEQREEVEGEPALQVVLEDVRLDRYSAAQAHDLYGVIILEGDVPAIDETATRKIRRQRGANGAD